MKVLRNYGFVSTISYLDFSGTEEEIESKNDIFERACKQSGITPLFRFDLYDEILLTFETVNAAAIFLTNLFRTSISDAANKKTLSIRAGLCAGDYFNDSEQIYGDTVNFATKLAYSSRKNEILVCGINQSEIKNCIPMESDISLYSRNNEENCYSISLIDEDLTNATMDNLTFRIEYNNSCQELQLARNKEITIGRSNKADIFIDDYRISRNHATITFNNDKIFLKDHSANGTYIYIDGVEKFITNDTFSLPEKGQIFCGQRKLNNTNPDLLNENEISFQLRKETLTY